MTQDLCSPREAAAFGTIGGRIDKSGLSMVST